VTELQCINFSRWCGPPTKILNMTVCVLLFVGSCRPERDTGTQHAVRPHSSNSLTVQGFKTHVQQRSATQKNLTPRTAGKTVQASRRAKIRNYNIKDDASDRH